MMPEDSVSTAPVRNSAARLAAAQALYQMELVTTRPDIIIRDFLEKKMPHETGDNEIALPQDFEGPLFSSIVRHAIARKADIEGMLQTSLDAKWPFDRLEKLLRAILRAGAAELLEHGTIDTGIIINDYVNVAHGFFAGKEPALVNAVLDRIAKQLRS